jgi:hypothetical protein
MYFAVLIVNGIAQINSTTPSYDGISKLLGLFKIDPKTCNQIFSCIGSFDFISDFENEYTSSFLSGSDSQFGHPSGSQKAKCNNVRCSPGAD